MRSFEIFVDPPHVGVDPVPADDAADHDSCSLLPKGDRAKARAREVIDIFIGGANVTARVRESQGSCVVRDLGAALLELSTRPLGKAIVRFYDDPWELAIERFGSKSSLSVYRAGAEPSVAVLDRWAPFQEVVDSAREAMETILGRVTSPGPLEAEMRVLAERLRSVDASCGPEAFVVPPTPVTVETDRDATLSLGAEFALRAGSCPSDESSCERADLHALLFRGKVHAEVRGRAVDLGETHPFLVAEHFLGIARRTLAAWEQGQAFHVRASAAGVLVGVRLTSDAQLGLTLGRVTPVGGVETSPWALTPDEPLLLRAVTERTRALHTFPALAVPDLVEAALAFGRALVRALLRRDRSQSMNLRLSGFRRLLRETGDTLRDACQADAKVNPSPESYRAFASGARPAAPQDDASIGGGRLRYVPRWRAEVPGIDLRATFLCGDRLVVGAAAETFCLDRQSGNVLWRAPTERATSVLTPGGVARVQNDGTLSVHDFGTGEVTLRTWLAPRLGGPLAGAVVHVPGLPRLLVLTEGERHLVAIDLTSGEPRWRFAWGGSAKSGRTVARGALRMKRAGKLLYLTSGDGALTALDVLSGALIWRVRDRLRFRAVPTIDHEALFAVAGGAHGAAHLHRVDPFSGQVRWTTRLGKPRDERARSATPEVAVTVEGQPLSAGCVVAVPVRSRGGLTLHAFDRETGAFRWASAGVATPSGTAFIALDDLIIGNTPTGDLFAIDAASGAVRYQRSFGQASDADAPRRLEPVLRSGALFVPHTGVHVVRPSDGALLGAISPCDVIPDLLRVDERCDVYVAEESGHLLAFGAGPRLALVRGGA